MPPLETMGFLFFTFALIAAGLYLAQRVERRGSGSWVIGAVCGLFVLANFGARDLDGDAELRASLPGPVTDGGFVSSVACRSCHPSEYHSWHGSYHRTMTQPATVESVLGDFDGVVLENRGHTCRLERKGDQYRVEMVDPLWFWSPSGERPANPPRVDARVVMTTGSHHLQTYWVRRPSSDDAYLRPDDGAFLQVPWAWLVAEKRWVPTQDSFLSPPTDVPERLLPWNTSCNLCHSVATQPHLGTRRYETRSVELGIACEACHGPGADHVRANQSPLRRYRKHFAGEDEDDVTIINPAKLDPKRSVEVCGQCHSFHKELDMARWTETGVAFRPGDELGETKAVFRYTENPTHPRLLEHLKGEPDALVGRFWTDGTMRVAGREYNGLLESRCFTHGEMTCLSCHSMHDYRSPEDQLADDGNGDESGDRSCLQCHEDIGGKLTEHTHHGPDSDGSRCMNCHMPHTTYGLLVAMRSHRIDSPSAAVSARTGRPNACNICHLDRSLGWTAESLSEWYGHGPVSLTGDQRQLAAAVLWATTGDAAQRAITAWAMGWPPARRASGERWQGAFLSMMLADPYAVIRQVAYKSLVTFRGFEGFEFDYVAPRDRILDHSRRALATWRQGVGAAPDRHGPHLLLDENGQLDAATHGRLSKSRDDTPLRIIE